MTEMEGPTALKAIPASSVGLSGWQGARESQPAARRPVSACGSVLDNHLGGPGGGKERYRWLVLTSEELMPFDSFRSYFKKDLLLIFLNYMYVCISACGQVPTKAGTLGCLEQVPEAGIAGSCESPDLGAGN